MVRTCEICPPATCRPADFYCDADACYLCTVCDTEVHSANRLAQRHIRRRLTPVETCTSVSGPPPGEASQDVEILFEDVADYDFSDFGSLDAKMPSLALMEDDAMFQCKSFSRGLVSYLSWESMIPDSVEHVVPDFEPLSPEPTQDKVEPHLEPVVMDHVKYHPQPPSSPLTPVPTSSASRSPPASSPSTSSTVTRDVSKRPAPTVMRKSGSKQDLVRPVEVEHQTPEQRKLLRMKALARFRSKRASRSFAKKVRYECRKQLADSRPRVKGRFVKKSEMALYRKYGALYRNHMHELSTIEAEDQCVPTF